MRRIILNSASIFCAVFAVVSVWAAGRYLDAQNRELHKALEALFREPRKALEVLIEEAPHEGPSGSDPSKILRLTQGSSRGSGITMSSPPFSGNVFQIQSLTISLNDLKTGKGLSFDKAAIPLFFSIYTSGSDTETMRIVRVGQIPECFLVKGVPVFIQRRMWDRIWAYALDPGIKDNISLKNIVISAPEGGFTAGLKYTVTLKEGGDMEYTL